jgi:hypothetical protein
LGFAPLLGTNGPFAATRSHRLAAPRGEVPLGAMDECRVRIALRVFVFVCVLFAGNILHSIPPGECVGCLRPNATHSFLATCPVAGKYKGFIPRDLAGLDYLKKHNEHLIGLSPPSRRKPWTGLTNIWETRQTPLTRQDKSSRTLLLKRIISHFVCLLGCAFITPFPKCFSILCFDWLSRICNHALVYQRVTV